MPTIKEIAKACNVSVATVSNIINHKGSVGDATRERVEQVIREMNYTPNYVAKNLKTKNTRSIGVIAEDMTVFALPDIIDGITEYCEEEDYQILLVNLRLYKKFQDKYYRDNRHKEIVRQEIQKLLAKQVEGIIYVAAHERLINIIPEDLPIPTVVAYGFTGSEKIPSVVVKDIKGAYDLVSYIVSKGHKKIGVITGPETSKPGYDRCAGYKRALKKHNIEINENYIVRGGFKEEGAYCAMKVLMEQKEPPTAVFSCNNMTTLGCLRYMQEKGMKLTRDISMVCFDEIKELEYTDIRLTSVARPIYEMGYEAMHILEKRYEDKEKRGSDRYIIRRHTVNPKLVKRGSEKYLQF